jgi:hypothetical protein
LLTIVIVIALLVCAAAIQLPNLCRAGTTANKAKCASDLHQIGLAIKFDEKTGRVSTLQPTR